MTFKFFFAFLKHDNFYPYLPNKCPSYQVSKNIENRPPLNYPYLTLIPLISLLKNVSSLAGHNYRVGWLSGRWRRYSEMHHGLARLGKPQKKIPPPRLRSQKNGYKFKKKIIIKNIFSLAENPLPPPNVGKYCEVTWAGACLRNSLKSSVKFRNRLRDSENRLRYPKNRLRLTAKREPGSQAPVFFHHCRPPS